MDFPDPFAPSTTDTRPASKRRLTPIRARTAPYVLLTPCSSTPAPTNAPWLFQIGHASFDSLNRL